MYKALIVDDEKMIRMGIQAVIPWKNLNIDEVYTAASGREALEIIRDKEPDIMVTDISMTEMTGLELISQSKEIQPNMKIIVLTGYDNFEYARTCLRMQVEDFFLKPIDEDILAAALEKLVGKLDNEKNIEQAEKLTRRTEGTSDQNRLENTMRNLAHNRLTAEKTDEFCREFYYTTDQAIQVAIIMPALYLQDGSHEDNFMSLSIKDICMGMVDVIEAGITFTDDDGKIIIAFFENKDLNDIMERLDQLNNVLKDEFDIHPKVVIGSLVDGFINLHISYNDAVYLLETEKENIREIIQTRNTESRYYMFFETFNELKNIMTSNMGNTEKIQKAFETFRLTTESYNMAGSLVRRCCFDMAATLYFNHIMNTGKAVDNKLNSYLTAMIHANREAACDLTRTFIAQLFSGEEENIHEIVQKAKAYIAEHLAEDLSVSSLAAILYITPNYFSRLFKKVTKEGCNEYIVRKRIDQAKSLLESTNIKTREIALMVGYHDTNYFSLAFKKHTGESPTRYRELSREKI